MSSRRIADLVGDLRTIVGKRNLLLSRRATLRYRRGYRSPPGEALAVARPGTLVEFWQVLQACVRADAAILIQAANTSLTGGSNPGDCIPQSLVIVSTSKLSGLHLIEKGAQIVSLPGTTLHQLERALRPYGREPHSVIGSSCFGASIVGGICNNSGGALVQRGPAYTELALFAQIQVDGTLRLVNRLGIDLGDDPETMLQRLEDGDFSVRPATGAASDTEYRQHVRAINEATPARFNADPRRLYDASGSAGKLAVFAVRLDTFPSCGETVSFYLGTNSTHAFTRLRRAMLEGSNPLPISAEYLHRDAFDVANEYGRDTFYAIRWLGTDRLPWLFSLKGRLDALGEAVGIRVLSERLLQLVGRMLPTHLPKRLLDYRRRYEHHLILKVAAAEAVAVSNVLSEQFPEQDIGWFRCSKDEAAKAELHRFVAAGAATRFGAIKQTGGIVALDVALPRNATEWFGELRSDLQEQVLATLRYGHFFCHVFHRDYVLDRGTNVDALKARLLAQLDLECAEYPAEHNVGRQYHAKPGLIDFYRSLDPTNRFNPGIGKTTTRLFWD